MSPLDGQANAAALDQVESDFESRRYRTIFRGPRQSAPKTCIPVKFSWKEKAALDTAAKVWIAEQTRKGKLRQGFGIGCAGTSTFIRAMILKKVKFKDA